MLYVINDNEKHELKSIKIYRQKILTKYKEAIEVELCSLCKTKDFWTCSSHIWSCETN